MELWSVIVFLLCYPLRQGAPSRAWTTSSPPLTIGTTPAAEKDVESEPPSSEAWHLADNEEIVTDWVKLRWGTGNEEDADDAFDDRRNTAFIIDPTIYGNVVTFYALFFSEVNVKGVRIIVDHWTEEDIITVELDPEMVSLIHGTLSPRTVCPLRSSVQSLDGLKTIEYKCEKISTANIWVVFKLPAGHSLAVYDVYMYGNYMAPQVETYQRVENAATQGMFTLSSSSPYYSYTSQAAKSSQSAAFASQQSASSTSWQYFKFSDDFAKDNGDHVTWQPEFEDLIPYKELVDKQEKKVEKQEEAGKGSNLLGFLTGAGYLDYVMTENKVEDKIDEEKKRAMKETKARVLIDSNDIKNSIQVFQKFNGFPETGTLSRDILEFVKQPRCGNHDVEYTIEEVQQEALLCDTVFSRSEPTQRTSFDCEGFNGAGPESKCVNLPSESRQNFIEDGVPYTIDIDVQFKPQAGGSWEDLKNKFHIFFNYDTEVEQKLLDKINLFAEENQFGFFYEKKKAGKERTLDDYKMTKTQIARREFKIRIDVEKNRDAFLLVNGHDVGNVKYKRRLKPSVRLQWQDKVPEIITARICKRPEVEESGRAKRSASTHAWGGNLITFNFQNYSTHLGEEGTRKGVLDALKVISISAKLEFEEKSPLDVAMITYMFIKGKHADGKTFHGAGVEKAHAFSPVHSEVHFNDYEQFTLKKVDRYATSMFYVALHETGHALGMKHSQYKDAVMAAGYVTDKAFRTKMLHRVDKTVLRSQYPGEIPQQAKVVELEPAKRPLLGANIYQPKLPLPRDCFGKIEAAFSFGTTLYLISNTFMWQYKMPEVQMIGQPQRVSNVLAGWNYIVKATFTVGDKLYILGDRVAHRYSRYRSIWLINKESTVDELLNTVQSNIKFPTVKSAFTLTIAGGGLQTTLVTGTKEYYKITWRNSNKVSTVEQVKDSSGTSLLGKTYGETEFNAAVPYEREKKGVKFTEILKFDGKYVKSVKVYHKAGDTVRKRDPYQEVPKAFGIRKWCAPKLNG